jgi:uncharacterized protein (DUF2141 family)
MVRVLIFIIGLPILVNAQSSLSINLSKFRGQSTCFGVALYHKEGFLVEKQALYTDYFCNVDGKGEVEYQIVDSIPGGRYALAVFEDLNNNRKLDKNLTGIPIEPYVFSNNAGSKWTKPTFEDASFELSNGSNHLFLKLKYWKEY